MILLLFCVSVAVLHYLVRRVPAAPETTSPERVERDLFRLQAALGEQDEHSRAGAAAAERPHSAMETDAFASRGKS